MQSVSVSEPLKDRHAWLTALKVALPMFSASGSSSGTSSLGSSFSTCKIGMKHYFLLAIPEI